MPIGLLKDMAAICPANARLMGLDLGTKTIGVAVSNSDQSIATPVTTIQRRKFTRDIEDLGKIIKEYEIGGYVLGWPVHMVDGSKSPRCDAAESFAHEMKNYPHIFGEDPWIAFCDERLSTATVDNFLVQSVDMSRKRRKEVVDKLAAQIILNDALEYLAKGRVI